MTIRTAIVGFGLSGQTFHEPALAHLPEFTIEAVVTTSGPRKAEACDRGHLVLGDARVLLDAKNRPDLLVVATPPAAHAAVVTAALERGIAVVVDKPFATSVSAAEAMIGASRAGGVPLFVYQNRRWDGDFLTVRRLVDEGSFGTVTRFESSMEKYSGETLRAAWQSSFGVADGGGVLFDLGSHLVDQALQLLGPADVVHAETSTVVPGRASEDEAFVSLIHGSGARSHLTMSRAAWAGAPRMRVLGTEAALTIIHADGQEAYIKGGGSVGDAAYGVADESGWGTLSSANGNAIVPMERGDYPAFYRGVAACLSGKPSPVDPADSLAALKIILAAHRMADQEK